jgi:Ca2+:H+ antiporter
VASKSLGIPKPSLSWLIIFAPVALVLRWSPQWSSDTWLFVCSGLAIIPLAGWMGQATESLASRLGHGIGGLLNATFGNAAEMIIALMALSKGLTGMVKASLTGSIIGNLLLVFGCSALFGGLKFRKLEFNQTAARASLTSLTLAAVALLIPSVFHQTAATRPGGWDIVIERRLSLAIAAVLFLSYICLLIFELVTHRQLYAGAPEARGEKELDDWSPTRALVVLLLSTAAVAIMSEFLVSAVEGARAALGLTEVFVGVIVVAIIGNAAEHSSAVWMAMKNKMQISLGISAGSSLQIALFVAPVLVFASLLLGHPLDLEFSIPEVVAVIVTVYLVFQISGDGETNWIEGVQLLALYIILGILFFWLPPEHPK